ncbi:hypothetical protein JOM56_010376 [Amanita muscaria]
MKFSPDPQPPLACQSDKDQISSSLHAVYRDATINHTAEGQGGLFDNLFRPSQAFIKNDVNSVIELLEVYQQRLSENIKAMKELNHRRQGMMANPNIGNSAILSIPNGDEFLPFPGFQFGGNEPDAIRYHAQQGLGMDVLHHVGTLDGVGPPVYRSMTVTGQQQASAILSHNIQSSTTDIGKESLPCRELASYRDQRTAPFTPAYASSPQSTNFEHGHAPVIAIGGAKTPDDQGPPAKRVKLTPASFRNGRVPGKSPKASDYEEGIEKMLLNAMHEFACLIFTVNAFPDDEIQIQWAQTVWKNACNKADSHYELSHRMIKLITERDSWARGLLKDAAHDAFHHKDPEAGTGFAENSIVADILETALFEDSSDYGVRFAKYFNPIPINLLALVFTIIEFLIDEYTTGEKTSFREKNNIEQFEKHSQRIEEWNKLNKQVTTNIRMKLFKKLMKRAGASHGPSPVVAGMTMSMREKAQQALDGRTGETDSEAE